MLESVFCVKKHLQQFPFKIYNASAGSGKTHTLTKAYLKIALTGKESFRKILAITFTNKAVNEMKHRILDSLFQFSGVEYLENAPPLFLDLMNELHIDAPILRERSRATLKDILHNYAFFDISTIDKFTHRLIRTFAKDLKLPQNFEVVLDKDLLLDEAVTRLVYKAGTDKKLTKVLIDFALEKIDDNKSWDISFDLLNIGKLLFNEAHGEHLEKIKNKQIDDFLGLKTVLRKRRKLLEKSLSDMAAQTLQLIAEEGLETTDFTSSYFPKFLIKIADGDLNMNFNAGWKQNIETTILYKKSPSAEVKSKIDRLHPQFVLVFKALRSGYYELAFLKNAYGNIVPLTVLNAIQQEVKAVQTENDQLSISEFNTLISKEIRNQPAPFIYERLGEKYRHYFVDEFQDTSSLQWKNLVPLIGNVLESEDMQGKRGSLFLVGDAKQAIYRWRGGRAEQFLNLANAVDTPFVTPPETQLLPVNYRSHEEVIKFNNDFFTATSEFLNNELYKTLFIDGNKQGYNAKKGGTVQIDFIEENDESDKNDLYCDAVLKIIKEVTNKKYGYESVCILVRGKKDGVKLADFLAHQEIPTISSESLLLNSSDKVRFLVHIIEFINDHKNLDIGYELLSFLSEKKQHRHAFISKHLHDVALLLKVDYNFDLNLLKHLSVYDGVELAIKHFDLAPVSDAYITYFMDVVYEVEQKDGTGVQVFLSYWNKKKDDLSISAPENIDAVRIMTIHKAKGLEFPIVIFPFANEDIYKRMDKKLWLPLHSDIYHGFDEVLVTEKKEVEHYSDIAANLYVQEEHKMELDAINVLYVALTRAEKALYIISEKDLVKDGSHKTARYSGLLIDYLKKRKIWEDEKFNYSFGVLKVNTATSIAVPNNNITYGYTYKNRPGFRIMAKSGMLWDTDREAALERGNLLHYILGLIKTEDDVDSAFQYALQKGNIASNELERVKNSIRQVTRHPDLNVYFKSNVVVKNEKDIITKDGRLLRPDRINFHGNTVSLLDYKTGRPNVKYKEQLYTYADALRDMGYTVENRIIIYINDEVAIERV